MRCFPEVSKPATTLANHRPLAVIKADRSFGAEPNRALLLCCARLGPMRRTQENLVACIASSTQRTRPYCVQHSKLSAGIPFLSGGDKVKL